MPKASSKSLTPAARPIDEKITINLGCVDLGQIDLLVQEGFYSNRTDFIRSAIRTQLATRAAAVEQSVARRTLVLGTQTFTRAQLEKLDASLKSNAEYIVKLEAMLTVPKGKELFKALSERRDAYSAARNALIKLIKDGQIEQAGKFVRPRQQVEPAHLVHDAGK